MKNNKIVLFLFFSLIYNLSYSQITSLDYGNTIDTFGASDSTSVFSNWNTTIGEFNNEIKQVQKDINNTVNQLKEHNTYLSSIYHYIYIAGKRYKVPRYLRDNVDYFLLTNDGINLYLLKNPPIYMENVDEDVIKWVQFFAYKKRKYTQSILNNYDKWKFMIEPLFVKNKIPKEISLLCLVESGCNLNALSPVGAKGMWQFMPETAKDFGMVVNNIKDERNDPYRSTKCAISYLNLAYNKINDWSMSIASYNCGIKRVQNLVTKYNSNKWEVLKPALPKETQGYIPALIAIYYINTYRKELGFI